MEMIQSWARKGSDLRTTLFAACVQGAIGPFGGRAVPRSSSSAPPVPTRVALEKEKRSCHKWHVPISHCRQICLVTHAC